MLSKTDKNEKSIFLASASIKLRAPGKPIYRAPCPQCLHLKRISVKPRAPGASVVRRVKKA